MAYALTTRAPGASDLTAKNRVWGNFSSARKPRPANLRNPQQPHRKNRPTATKPTSGIPYWPSRDPIEEHGGNNLYGFVLNNPLFYIDVLGNQISIPAGVAGAAAAGWSATDIAATFGVSLAIAQAAIQAERCKVLRAAVKAAKQAVGAVAGKCKCTDSPEVIAAKTAAWCALAEARWNQNQECFSGGDPTHVEEQQKAYDKCVECKNTVSNQP